MFDHRTVVSANIIAGEDGIILNHSAVLGAFASMDYYPTTLHKVCSVVRSVMQNHPFANGNKRTGVLLLFGACECLSIPVAKTDDEIVEFAVTSVVERWSVEQIVNWISS